MSRNLYLIIRCMLQQKDVFTYSEIAKSLGLSNKTIRNYLPDIIPIFNRYSLALSRKQGVGLYLSGKTQNKLACLKYCEERLLFGSYYSAQSRRMIIKYLLLTSEDVMTVSQMEEWLFITRPSIYNDLKKIESDFSEYDIAVLRNRSRGVSLVAGEKRRRIALLDLLTEIQSHDSENFKYIPHCDLLNNLIKGNKDVPVIREQLGMLSSELNKNIPDSNLQRLTYLIALSFARLRQGNTVTLNPDNLKKIDETVLLQRITDCIDCIAETCDIELSCQEFNYLRVKIALVFQDSCHCIKHSDIVSLSEVFYCDLNEYLHIYDQAYFIKGIEELITNLMQRYCFEKIYFNPHKRQIQDHHKRLFELAERINCYAEKYIGFTVPAESVADITMLLACIQEGFADSIRCALYLKERTYIRHMIHRQLENALPGVDIVLVDKVDDDNYDLFISNLTTDLPNSVTIPAFISGDVIVMLREIIDDLRAEKRCDFWRTKH